MFAKTLAIMYRSDNRLDEALVEISRATDLSPFDSSAWQEMANIFLALGRPDEAILAYTEVIAQEPFNRIAQRNRWGLMLERKENNAVLDEASALLKTQPHFGEALWASAAARFEGSDQAMIDALEAALLLSPEDPTLSLELGRKLEARGGDLSRVEGLYRAVITEIGSQIGLVNEAARLLGRLLAGDNRWLEAFDVVRSPLISNPTPELLLLRSEIEFNLNRPQVALKLVREVARLTPQRADVWVTLGGLEMNQGNLPRALQAYEQAVGLGLDNEYVRSQLAAISSRMRSE